LISDKAFATLRPDKTAGHPIMRLAVISDIHANAAALEACLRHCASLDVTQLVFLGDLVGYGPDPEAVVSRIVHLARQGAIVIRGNHDEAVDHDAPDMHDAALQAIRWTRGQLGDASRRFLAGLPMTATVDDVLLVHGDASDPPRWRYVTDAVAARRSLAAATARVTLCGHVHVPALYCLTALGRVILHNPASEVPIPLGRRHRWLAVAGAAGQPRDGNPAASFLTYDTASGELVYRRAAYDVEATVARMRAAGLPERLAERLLTGH
jgi:predicted phosphodiesterase